MPSTPTEDISHWSLDKRIPLAVVIGMFVQLAGFVWYAATLNSRVHYLEAQQLQTAGADLPVKVATLDVQFTSMSAKLDRMERKLDQVLDKD